MTQDKSSCGFYWTFILIEVFICLGEGWWKWDCGKANVKCKYFSLLKRIKSFQMWMCPQWCIWQNTQNGTVAVLRQRANLYLGLRHISLDQDGQPSMTSVPSGLPINPPTPPKPQKIKTLLEFKSCFESFLRHIMLLNANEPLLCRSVL